MYSLGVLCAFVVKTHLHFQRITPSYPLKWRNTDKSVVLTEPTAALSGHSRASRRSRVTIQRFAPLNPPAISADVLQNLRLSLHPKIIALPQISLPLF